MYRQNYTFCTTTPWIYPWGDSASGASADSTGAGDDDVVAPDANIDKVVYFRSKHTRVKPNW